MSSVIDTFRKNWGFVRGLSYDFIAGVPENRWEASPHTRFSPLHKQVRHMVCVQGVYTEGLRNRRTDFGKKHTHYGGPLDRDSLVAALREKDHDLERALADLASVDPSEYVIEFYGANSLAAYLNVYATHESLHHGQWSFYAALGGWETPQSWKLNWGL